MRVSISPTTKLPELILRVHEYPDGQLADFHGPHRLADYRPDGTRIEETLLNA